MPPSLEVCEFTGTVTFSEAHAPAIRLINCQLGNLHADQLETRGTLDLSFSTATAEVRLSGAHIGGALNLDGAKLLNDWTEALIADGIRVDQDMSLDRNFVARGGVRLIGAHIGGSLLFHGAELTGAKEDGNRFGPALSADRLRVDQLLNLGVVTKGEARLAGAQIGGPLVLDEAKLTNESGPALSAERLHVDQDVFCRAKFSAKGEVRLVGAHIGGQVSFDGATLRGDGTTLDLSGAQTESAVLRFAKRPAGAVNLRAAKRAGSSIAPTAAMRSGLTSDWSTAATTRFTLLRRSTLSNGWSGWVATQTVTLPSLTNSSPMSTDAQVTTRPRGRC